jgi:hypothetical protein
MNSTDLTLGQLLFHQDGDIPDAIWSKIIKKPPMPAILACVSPDMLNGTQAEIRNSISGLFQTDLVDFLLAGWHKYQDISKSLEKSRQKPADTFLMPLVPHTLKSVQHPCIEVFVDDKPMGKIVFDLTIALDVNAISLKIQQGQIIEILTGTCQGSITLAYEKDNLASAKTGEIHLPGKIKVAASADRSVRGNSKPVGSVGYVRP